MSSLLHTVRNLILGQHSLTLAFLGWRSHPLHRIMVKVAALHAPADSGAKIFEDLDGLRGAATLDNRVKHAINFPPVQISEFDRADQRKHVLHEAALDLLRASKVRPRMLRQKGFNQVRHGHGAAGDRRAARVFALVDLTAGLNGHGASLGQSGLGIAPQRDAGPFAVSGRSEDQIPRP